jgi:hypothetical protein
MRWRVAVAGVLCAIPVGTAAHHSIAGVYDRDRPATLEAVVREWRFVNPHPRIVVEVAAASGEAQTWTLEMDNRWELAELGFEVETLKPGDRIIVAGNPGRDSDNVLYVRKLERPVDGFNYVHHP